MIKDDVACLHVCKNSCSLLNEALKKEVALVRFYESIYSECSYSLVQEFLLEMIEQRREGILHIINKLNEIHAYSNNPGNSLTKEKPGLTA